MVYKEILPIPTNTVANILDHIHKFDWFKTISPFSWSSPLHEFLFSAVAHRGKSKLNCINLNLIQGHPQLKPDTRASIQSIQYKNFRKTCQRYKTVT